MPIFLLERDVMRHEFFWIVVKQFGDSVARGTDPGDGRIILRLHHTPCITSQFQRQTALSKIEGEGAWFFSNLDS